jgi:acetyl-CoA C-acetyltransferase
MREAVIVSTARTPIGKAYRGAFNNTQAQALAGHAIRQAVDRAGLEGGEIDDVVFGAALQQGSQGMNVARQAALRAGLPLSVPGQSMDRQCSSGLMAIATAAKQIIVDGHQIAVGGGVESISLVQNEHQNVHRMVDPELRAMVPGIYTAMIETAEVVAERYSVSREAQDEYSLQSQQRTAQAQEEGRFDPEIVPLTTTKILVNKETGETTEEEVTLTKDEGNRPTTTLEDLQKLAPVWRGGQFAKEGKYVTAGNASQLSDGAAAVVLMEAGEAERRGSSPSAPTAAWPSRVVPPRRWASVRCSPCRSCSSRPASRWTTSASGSSTRPSPASSCTAATPSASRTSCSTCRAAPSRSVTRTA